MNAVEPFLAMNIALLPQMVRFEMISNYSPPAPSGLKTGPDRNLAMALPGATIQLPDRLSAGLFLRRFATDSGSTAEIADDSRANYSTIQLQTEQLTNRNAELEKRIAQLSQLIRPELIKPNLDHPPGRCFGTPS